MKEPMQNPKENSPEMEAQMSWFNACLQVFMLQIVSVAPEIPIEAMVAVMITHVSNMAMAHRFPDKTPKERTEIINQLIVEVTDVVNAALIKHPVPDPDPFPKPSRN